MEESSGDDVAQAPVDPELFLRVLDFIQDNHSHQDDGEELIETIFLMGRFFRENKIPDDRPWDTMFAIQTRMTALIRLFDQPNPPDRVLKEIKSGQFWMPKDAMRLAASAPLVRSETGNWAFNPQDFVTMSAASDGKEDYEWDAAKATANLEQHGVPFEAIYRFDWANAIEAEDTRFDYGETRMQALGKIGDRLHVLVYTHRKDRIRVISLRKANRREIK